MSITFNGSALNWYTHTIVKDGTTVSSPTATGLVKFGTTDVFGVGNFSSETTLFDFVMKPDSQFLENAIATMLGTAAYAIAIKSYYYSVGPGSDTKIHITLRKGYRMVTGDGTFTGNDSSNFFLFEGQTVTGANTSHNGDTSCSLRRDNGI